MKKIISLLMAACLMLCLCACGAGVSQADFNALAAEVEQLRADVDALQGGDTEAADPAEEAEEAEDAEADEGGYDPNVDCIDLVLDEGELKYTGFEEANSGLTDYDNALLFEFDFTNFEAMPAQVQENFRIQFFQNGAELDNDISWSSNGGDQYDLVGAFFDDALNNGTVSFAKIVVPEDDSPITVMVSRNGGSDDTECQMMEVDIAGGADAAAAPEAEPAEGFESSDVSAEQVEADLQGDWDLSGDEDAVFSFNEGDFAVNTASASMNGTYEINTDTSTVDGTLEATDGEVTIHLPYYYEDGALVITNNDGQALVKE